MQKIDRIILTIIKYVRLIACYLMLLVTGVAVAQVIARYIFNNSIIWSEEFCMGVLIWFGFFCISSEVYLGGHMSVEFFYNHFPAWLKKVCDILKNIVITGFSVMMIKYTIKVSAVIGDKLLPVSGLPKIIIYIPVTACAVLMTVYGLVMTIQTIAGYVSKEVNDNE